MSVLDANKDLSYPELETLFSSAANLVNQRPLGVRNFKEDDIRSITPNDLLLGRNRQPFHSEVVYGDADNLPLRLEIIQELQDHWLKLWVIQVFPSLVPFRRWKIQYRNPQVNNIVLVQYSSMMSKGDYRLARISEVHPDCYGVTRTVTVKTRPRDAREKVETKPPYLHPKTHLELKLSVQRICMILPVEEQVHDGEKVPGEVVEDEDKPRDDSGDGQVDALGDVLGVNNVGMVLV